MAETDETDRRRGRVVAIAAGATIAVGLGAALLFSGDEGSSPRETAATSRDTGSEPAPTDTRSAERVDPERDPDRDAEHSSRAPRGALSETTSNRSPRPHPAIAVGLHELAVREEHAGSEAPVEWRRVLRLDRGDVPSRSRDGPTIDALRAELQLMRAQFGSGADAGGEPQAAATKSPSPEQRTGPTFALLVERTAPLSLLRRVLRTASSVDITRYEVVALAVGRDDERRGSRARLEDSRPETRSVEFRAGRKSDGRDRNGRQPLHLTVEIRARGFAVGTAGALLPTREGCPWDGPTVCLQKPQADPLEGFARARRAALAGDLQRSEHLLEAGIEAYDFAELYRTVEQVHSEYPDASQFWISSPADVPFELIVRVADALRWNLDLPPEASAQRFWSIQSSNAGQSPLFPEPVISLEPPP